MVVSALNAFCLGFLENLVRIFFILGGRTKVQKKAKENLYVTPFKNNIIFMVGKKRHILRVSSKCWENFFFLSSNKEAQS